MTSFQVTISDDVKRAQKKERERRKKLNHTTQLTAKIIKQNKLLYNIRMYSRQQSNESILKMDEKKKRNKRLKPKEFI